MLNLPLQIYDTTLRDGTQQEGFSLSVNDKLRLAQRLADFGVHFIEGGFPGSNPKDTEFFQAVKKLKLKKTKITAFCSTRHKNFSADKDPNLQAVLNSGVEVATIFGKTWDLHATKILGVTLVENLKIIEESIAFLHKKGMRVIFDAEHFFDGFRENPDYALKCLEIAIESGAENLSLCDTNGGALPDFIAKAVKITHEKFPQITLGIHTHNDCELAVANTIAAVKAGATLIQGTINGYGERTGNANLCSIIPILQLKMKQQIVSPNKLQSLRNLSLFFSEVTNQNPYQRQAFVGASAFAHKGGIHAAAVAKLPKSYEHIDPTAVGNLSRVTVSELSGRSNVIILAKSLGYQLKKDSESTVAILQKVKELEALGFQFEGAEGSFELLLKRARKNYHPPFKIINYSVITKHIGVNNQVHHPPQRTGSEQVVEATVCVEIKRKKYYVATLGNGPVNALDQALRKALLPHFPQLKNIKLFDYKVRILNSTSATAAKTRVLIESGNSKQRWCTVGCSENIIEASCQALVDALEYGIKKNYEL